MFTYSEEMNNYLTSRRKKVIDKNKKTAKTIKQLLNTFRPDDITYMLAFKIIESVERCTEEIYSRSTSTLSFIANLRFLFETCIHARLLANESSYKYKLRYSIYSNQIKKSKGYESYAKLDISRLDTLINEKDKIKLDNSVKKQAKVDELYDALDEELSIFLDAAEYNGAEIHKKFIQEYLQKNQERETNILNAKKTFIDELLQIKEANEIFNFDGSIEDIDKKLKDKRNWKVKAEAVGLLEMYMFVYDYTSALVHSGSYSLLIPSQLKKEEVEMIIGLGTKISNDILKNLKLFAKLPDIAVLEINR